MPRFAANLGFNPLEPMKSSLAPTSAATTPTTAQSGNGGAKSTSSTDIPDVQFDWNSSGLVNPLDGMRFFNFSFFIVFYFLVFGNIIFYGLTVLFIYMFFKSKF